MSASVAVPQLVGALPPGTHLHEYVLERVLGHGGFGITYLARDTHLDKRVAIKEYLPNDLAARLSDSGVAARSTDGQVLEAFKWGLEKFVAEARVLARFSHPSLIQVHRYFEANGTAYFVMDYAEGVTLAEVLKDRETIPETHLRKIIFPVLNGLEEVHRLGILHRDIKPDNIILRRDNSQPVLIDFGAARQSLGQHTKSVLSVVTAGYAPLEQYGTNVEQGPWSDLYALGAVAYRAVAGKKPSDAVNRIRTDPVVEASVVGKGRYTAHFLAAIDWALAVNPEDRPQNIAEWRQALDGKIAPRLKAVTRSAKPVSTPENTVETTQVVKKSSSPGAEDIAPTVVVPRSIPAPQRPRKSEPPPAPAPGKPDHRLIYGGAAAVIVLVGALTLLLSGGDEEPPPPQVAHKAPAGEPTKVVAERIEAPAQPAPQKPVPSAVESYFPEDPAPAPAKPKPKPKPVQKPKLAAVASMAALSTFQDCPQCPLMVVLPAGTYAMGSLPGAPGGAAWEGPAHSVAIGKPFALGKFEVSGSEWQACAKAGACSAIPPGDAAAPAVAVDWAQAQAYAAWLSKTTGRRYRLPSEAEWEYAIRAGTTTARYWGEDRRGQCEYANGADLSAVARDPTLKAGDQACDDRQAALAPVGLFKPNAFGLHDMAGNAWEWTLDCWKDSYRNAPADGAALDAPNCTRRVIRGGSWRTKPESLRSANRGLSPAGHRSDDLGFRVAAE